jgi:RHS repeat-associated protein
MNFTLAPGGLDYDSAKWTQIGTVTSTGTETVSVTLSTGSTNSGAIPADAILFKPTGLDVARTTYEWDHQNRLTKVTNESAAFSATGVMTLSPRDTTDYAYDVLGRRAAVTYDLVGPADGGGDFRRVSVYDGSQVVWTETGTNREQMVSQGTTQAMLWAPGVDQLLAIQERLGGTGAVKQPVWTLTDHLGTVKDYLAKAPTAGAESGLLLTRRYSAFGAPLSAKQWNNVPTGGTSFTDITARSGFFYVGQEYDATTGLQYSRARYYDPVSSEFISQDPLGFAGGDTNLYRRDGNQSVSARPRDRNWSEWAWDNATYDSFSMVVHSGLAAAGAIPGVGIIPDAIDWVYTLVEMPFGKSTWTDLSLASAGIAATAVPVGGDQAAAAAKIAARAARVATQAASAVGTAAMAAARPIARGVTHSAGALPASVRRFVDEAIGAGKNAGGPVSAAKPQLNILNPHFTPDSAEVLQRLTNNAVGDLAANPGLARDLMSASSYRHLIQGTELAGASYGKAVERLVARYVREDGMLSSILQHTGLTRGANGRFVSSPDFLGKEAFNLRLLDITTQRDLAKHLRRPAGQSTTYSIHPGLPNGLVFPR